MKQIFDVSKVLEISKTFVDKFYPDIDFCLLTGSQVEENFVSVVSDIDILIIDRRFSGISSEGIVEDGYKIDFTRVGMYGLPDAIIESCYSRNNTIMNMIIQGIFIYDKFNIQESLKKYCTLLYRGSNLNYFNEYQLIRRNLLKLKKHFSKKLLSHQIPLVLSDLLLELSKAYLFFNHNGKYGIDGYRRMKLLSTNETDYKYLENINQIAINYYIENNNSFILNKIDGFLSYSLLNTKKLNDFRYIVNLGYAKSNSYNFFKKVIKNLREDDILNECFLYGKRVSPNHIFDMEFVIVFDNSITNDSIIYNQLNKIISRERIDIIKLTALDPFYLKELFFTEDIYLSYEPTFKVLNSTMITFLLDEQKFSYKKVIPILVYLIESSIFCGLFSRAYIVETLKFLLQKYRNPIYFQHKNSRQIGENIEMIELLNKMFIKKNYDIINEYRELVRNDCFIESIEETFPPAKNIRLTLSNLVNLNQSNDCLPQYFEKILERNFNNNISKGIVFIEFSMKALGLKESHIVSLLPFIIGIYDE